MKLWAASVDHFEPVLARRIRAMLLHLAELAKDMDARIADVWGVSQLFHARRRDGPAGPARCRAEHRRSRCHMIGVGRRQKVNGVSG